MNDVCSISHFQKWIDVPESTLCILSGLWSLSWQYREWKSVLQSPSGAQSRNSALITNSLYQEILQILELFDVAMLDLPGGIQPSVSVLFQQQLMNLHVSLEDVQLLAGKAGEKEARRVLPLLITWAQSQESRQAVWHAGQILRVVNNHSATGLEGSSAVAVYHASLVFWAYSIVSKSSLAIETAQRQDSTSGDPFRQWLKPEHMQAAENKVDLSGEKGSATQRFIALGKGQPAIRRSFTKKNANSNQSLILLTNTSAVMAEIIQLLRRKNDAESRLDDCSPLVENLARLMKTLGNAANGINLR